MSLSLLVSFKVIVITLFVLAILAGDVHVDRLPSVKSQSDAPEISSERVIWI